MFSAPGKLHCHNPLCSANVTGDFGPSDHNCDQRARQLCHGPGCAVCSFEDPRRRRVVCRWLTCDQFFQKRNRARHEREHCDARDRQNKLLKPTIWQVPSCVMALFSPDNLGIGHPSPEVLYAERATGPGAGPGPGTGLAPEAAGGPGAAVEGAQENGSVSAGPGTGSANLGPADPGSEDGLAAGPGSVPATGPQDVLAAGLQDGLAAGPGAAGRPPEAATAPGAGPGADVEGVQENGPAGAGPGADVEETKEPAGLSPTDPVNKNHIGPGSDGPGAASANAITSGPQPKTSTGTNGRAPVSTIAANEQSCRTQVQGEGPSAVQGNPQKKSLETMRLEKLLRMQLQADDSGHDEWDHSYFPPPMEQSGERLSDVSSIGSGSCMGVDELPLETREAVEQRWDAKMKIFRQGLTKQLRKATDKYQKQLSASEKKTDKQVEARISEAQEMTARAITTCKKQLSGKVVDTQDELLLLMNKVSRQQKALDAALDKIRSKGLLDDKMVSLADVFPLQEAQDFFRGLTSRRFRDGTVNEISQGAPYQQSDFEQLVHLQKAFDSRPQVQEYQGAPHQHLLFYFAYMCHQLPYRLPSRKLLVDMPYDKSHLQYMVSALLYLLGQSKQDILIVGNAPLKFSRTTDSGGSVKQVKAGSLRNGNSDCLALGEVDYKVLDLQDHDVVIITEAHLTLLEHRVEIMNQKLRKRGEELVRRPKPALVIAINQAQLERVELNYIHRTGFQSVRAREEGPQMGRRKDEQLLNELSIDKDRRRVAEYHSQGKKRNKMIACRLDKNPVIDELIRNAEQLAQPRMLSLGIKSQPDQVRQCRDFESVVCYPDAYLEMNPLKAVKLLHNVRNLTTLQKEMGDDILPSVSFLRQAGAFNLAYDHHWCTVPMLLHDLKLTRLLTLMHRARGSLEDIHAKGYFQGGIQPDTLMLRNDLQTAALITDWASARRFDEHHKRSKFPRRFYQDSLYTGTPMQFEADLPTAERFIEEDQAALAYTCMDVLTRGRKEALDFLEFQETEGIDDEYDPLEDFRDKVFSKRTLEKVQRDISRFMRYVTDEKAEEMKRYLMVRHKVTAVSRSSAIKLVWALLDSLARDISRPEIRPADLQKPGLLEHYRARYRKPSMQQQQREAAKRGRPDDDRSDEEQSYDAEAQLMCMEAEQARQAKQASKVKRRRASKVHRKQAAKRQLLQLREERAASESSAKSLTQKKKHTD